MVAAAWAMMAGCVRTKGQVTPVPTRSLCVARAVGEVREVEARLRVAPENDKVLISGLMRTLALKRERVERLQAAIEVQVKNADLTDDHKEIAVEG